MLSSLRYPPSSAFKSKQLRVYNPGETGTLTQPYITYYKKRRSYEESFAYARSKLGFIKAASCKCHINTIIKFNAESDGDTTAENVPSPSRYTDEEDLRCSFDEIPREIIFQIFKYLDANDLCSFARTCHLFRRYSYDNQLWKIVCVKTWSNPNFMLIDIDNSNRTLHEWFNNLFNMEVESVQVTELFNENMWRLIYIALEMHDAIPSIVVGQGLINARSIECYPVNRTIEYTTSTGMYKLVGVTSLSRIEHTVHDNEVKAWHRLECIDTRPLPIYDLRTYGLKMTRTVRGQYNNVGFLNRRGYYLKTDLNRKIHLSYRYFPSIRFRLFRQHEKIYLLCQDLLLTTGIASHCYTMYELIKTGEAEPQSRESTLVTEPSSGDIERSASESDEDESAEGSSISNGLYSELNHQPGMLSSSDSASSNIRSSFDSPVQSSSESASSNISSSFDFTVQQDFESRLVNASSRCITSESILLGVPVFYSMSSSSIQQESEERASEELLRISCFGDAASVTENDSGVLSNQDSNLVTAGLNRVNESDSGSDDEEGIASSENNVSETSL